MEVEGERLYFCTRFRVWKTWGKEKSSLKRLHKKQRKEVQERDAEFWITQVSKEGSIWVENNEPSEILEIVLKNFLRFRIIVLSEKTRDGDISREQIFTMKSLILAQDER